MKQGSNVSPQERVPLDNRPEVVGEFFDMSDWDVVDTKRQALRLWRL